MNFINASLLVLLVATCAYADVYMHNPRGSNDRNCERNDNRNNGNRLFDSQNNGKGGYACPRAVGGPEVKGNNMYYYAGSKLTIEWTAQHGCGPNSKVHCDIVLQYMCEDANPDIRDGTPENVKDAATDRVPDDEEQSKNKRFGLHETFEYYQRCKHRRRNHGLFIADRNVRSDATGTRQNNNGNRNGFECPEERDHYPYWQPTPWKDIAVLTADPARCPWYKANSNNVKSYGYCDGKKEGNTLVPNFKEECEERGFEWVEKSHNLPEPHCGEAQWTRVNQLGSTHGGYPVSYNWTIPDDVHDTCVLRLRYNISTGEYPTNDGVEGLPFFTHAQNAKIKESKAKFPSPMTHAGSTSEHAMKDRPFFVTQQEELEATEGAFEMKKDTQCTGTFQDLLRHFKAEDPEACKAECMAFATACAGFIHVREGDHAGHCFLRGGRIQEEAARAGQDCYVRKGYAAGDEDKSPKYFAALAMNSNQFGRTFQDRSFTFGIKPRPDDIPEGVAIQNLNVRGKRGNIVQAYPAVEYDFVPNALEVDESSYIHFQWEGSDYNPRRGPNNGEGGPPDVADNDSNQNCRADRSNLVETDLEDDNVPAPKHLDIQSSMFETPEQAWRMAFLDQTGCKTIGELAKITSERRRQNDIGNCGKLNGQQTPYFDGGLVKMAKPGRFTYMCTRNNNFSNRSQKGHVTVKPTGGVAAQNPLHAGLVVGSQAADRFTAFEAEVEQLAKTTAELAAVEVGCFKDSTSGRDLPTLKIKPTENMDAQRCIEACTEAGFRFAGVQNRNECWCGNSYGKHGAAPRGECAKPCTGEPSLHCGGPGRNLVYHAKSFLELLPAEGGEAGKYAARVLPAPAAAEELTCAVEEGGAKGVACCEGGSKWTIPAGSEAPVAVAVTGEFTEDSLFTVACTTSSGLRASRTEGSRMDVGDTVAFWNPASRRYISLQGGTAKGVGPMDFGGYDETKMAAETFLVVDGGRGKRAFWSQSSKRFLRLHANRHMDGSGGRSRWQDLPKTWTWERFTPVEVKGGEFAFYSNIHKRFPMLKDDGGTTATAQAATAELPGGSEGAMFRVKLVKRKEDKGAQNEFMRSYSFAWDHDGLGIRHAKSMLDSDQGWSGAKEAGTWMEIDLGREQEVIGVVTQGRANADQWVTKFTVGTPTDPVDGGEEFAGNKDRNTKVTTKFAAPVKARLVRIVVKAWHGHPSMRAGVLVQGADGEELVEFA